MNKLYPLYKHQEISSLNELISLYKDSDDTAISYNEKNIKVTKSFKDLYNDVTILSKYFSKTYHFKHIGIAAVNSYQYLILFLSITISGNVCVLIDKDYSQKEIKNLLKKSDTSILFYSDDYMEKINIPLVKTYPISKVNEIIENNKNLTNKVTLNIDNVAAIFFTSGTTGANKGVMLSNRNMASNIYGASTLFCPNGSVLSVLPFHHAFGLITSVLKPIYYKKEVFISSSLKYITKDLQSEKPSVLFLVPAFVETFYKQIWKKARSEHKENILNILLKSSNILYKLKIDLRRRLCKSILKNFGGNIEYIICGGAYLDPKYIKFFRALGIEILNGYGITECSPVLSVNRNFYHKDGTVGLKCPNIEIEIIDDEIVVTGPTVMLGYYNDESATKKVLKDGKFYTGDLGYIDSKGFIYITGRKKNTIILSNGENISPEQIESELLHLKGVSEVVVYSLNNELLAMIYPEEKYLDNKSYFDELINKYNQDKPKNHQIVGLSLRNREFIKNNNRKILRDKIMEE